MQLRRRRTVEMSKKIRMALLALPLILASLSAQAQSNQLAVSKPGEHWELQFSGGIHNMWDFRRDWSLVPAKMVTPAFEFTVGKWFTPEVGARLGWEGTQLEHGWTDRFNFAYVHADLMWDATNTFDGYSPVRNWSFIPYGHFGYLHEWRGNRVIEREYTAGVGLMGRYVLSNHLSLALDLRTSLLNGAASQGLAIAFIQTAQMGLVYSIGDPLWKSASAGSLLPGTAFDPDHWFIALGGGVNSLSQLYLPRPSFTGSVAPALELTVGKWVHPAIGIRAGVQGISYAGHGNNPRANVTTTPMENGTWAYREQFDFIYPHLDLLWNFVNTFRGYSPERKLVLAPYAHFGAIWELGHGHTIDREYGAGAGFLMQGPLEGAVGWYVDLRGTAFTAAATGDSSAPHSLGLTAMAGLQYQLGGQKWQRSRGGEPQEVLPTAVLPLFGAGQGWFVQTSVGMRSLWDLGVGFIIRSVQTPTVAGELAVGKWLSPVSGLRLGYSGLTQYMSGDKAGYSHLHADYLLNFLQWIAPKQERIWNPIPYVSGGYVSSYDFADPAHTPGASGWAFGAGLLNSFRLAEHLDLTFDVRSTLLSPKTVINTDYGYMVGVETLLGLQYRPGEKPWYGQPQPEPRNGRHLFALATNLADWADMATLNAELLYSVSRHFTLDALVKYNFLNTSVYDQRERYAIGVRWWPWYTYSGWWVRSMLQTEVYNRKGMPVWGDGSDQAWGLSFSGGYSLMLNKWLNLDLGAGFWGGRHGQPGQEQSWFIEPEMLNLGLMFVF